MRTLTIWEQTVSTALAPLGFEYHANPAGGGYWWHKEYGLQLTHDLEFHARGARECWNLTRMEGLVKCDLRLGSPRKRKPESQAAEIAERVKSFLGHSDWKDSPRWVKENLGG